MNPAFWILVIIIVVWCWLSISHLFPKVGRWLIDNYKQTMAFIFSDEEDDAD